MPPVPITPSVAASPRVVPVMLVLAVTPVVPTALPVSAAAVSFAVFDAPLELLVRLAFVAVLAAPALKVAALGSGDPERACSAQAPPPASARALAARKSQRDRSSVGITRTLFRMARASSKSACLRDPEAVGRKSSNP
jgi:hypothetical protein